MAAQGGPEDPPELLNYKTWVLKVSIHCEGCKRKVKKILQQVPGVYAIDIDLKQQKATVTGNVEAEALLRKLHKSGKHAELVPQQSDHKEKKPAKIKNKEKQIDPQSKEAATTTSQPETSTHKDVKSTGKTVLPKEPSVRIQDASGEVPKRSKKPSTVSAKPEEETGTASADEPAVAKGSEGGGKKENIDETVKESKSEGNKPETDSAGRQQIPVAAAEKKGADSDNAAATGEKSDAGPGGEASGSTGKKKKKKGQNSNNAEGTPSIVAPAGPEFEHHNTGPQISGPTNYSPPRQPAYHYYPQQGPQFYAPPPAYVVSYNTAQPTSSYTASYYAPAPPTSYAYTYSGPVTEPPPSDVDTYPRQPLDSLEMFSDENPNGCFIM